MADDADEEGRRNWCDPRRYESMLALNRRAWAEQCLSRDWDFIAAVASVVPTSSKSLRQDPSIIVITLPRDHRLAAWGLHFRSVLGSSAGEGLCRLAG